MTTHGPDTPPGTYRHCGLAGCVGPVSGGVEVIDRLRRQGMMCPSCGRASLGHPTVADSPNARGVVRFVVPGVAEPQGSTRGFLVRGRVRITSDNRKLKSWRLDAILCAQEALRGRPPVAGPVSVRLVFDFPRPQGHFGKRGLLPSAPAQKVTKPDLDKLVRAVLDALTQAGVVRDDSQVVSLFARKTFGAGGQTAVEVVEL